MPIYDWNNNLKKPTVFRWWIKRLHKTLQMADIVRIDHFRGLESCSFETKRWSMGKSTVSII